MNYPNEIVTEASRVLLGQGVRVLQGNRFAKSESDHLGKLIEHMNLNGETQVADMGCGFGEVSRVLSTLLHPGAKFYLVNTNRFQLDQCPVGDNFICSLEDMCSTSIPANSMNLVMFNYSLCHVDPSEALREAARIAAKKARLFVYDYQRLRGDDELAQHHLAARFLRDWQFRGYALHAGWNDIETIDASGDDHLFREAFDNDKVYDTIFNDLRPVIWRARR